MKDQLQDLISYIKARMRILKFKIGLLGLSIGHLSLKNNLLSLKIGKKIIVIRSAQ